MCRYAQKLHTWITGGARELTNSRKQRTNLSSVCPCPPKLKLLSRIARAAGGAPRETGAGGHLRSPRSSPPNRCAATCTPRCPVAQPCRHACFPAGPHPQHTHASKRSARATPHRAAFQPPPPRHQCTHIAGGVRAVVASDDDRRMCALGPARRGRLMVLY